MLTDDHAFRQDQVSVIVAGHHETTNVVEAPIVDHAVLQRFRVEEVEVIDKWVSGEGWNGPNHTLTLSLLKSSLRKSPSNSWTCRFPDENVVVVQPGCLSIVPIAPRRSSRRRDVMM